ncbi:hypothetical protein VOLCADRAFT_97790 [Volvox carteri f. nagariensis]|uniref:Pherophorin domain-containing protein n=1 Tax=Volvox carteri f. nagariensis TaxID=3068 RepID=D8UDM8_VOLCA|nr:uncharacterized protein VOLCADRAFT_97790 [Volvox carteri f. nagariensis]EFJ42190.1 hypothetical protein VOLCADRAFT_97790 [Volvox carteri f. nagariensis]|eukprot:XP_002956733.1 hypothetical protein VOLCADRAFT_97790 [Volvox carteri f. nagariensis]
MTLNYFFDMTANARTCSAESGTASARNLGNAKSLKTEDRGAAVRVGRGQPRSTARQKEHARSLLWLGAAWSVSGVHRLASFNSESQSFSIATFIVIVVVIIFMVMLPMTLAVHVARKERALLSPSNNLHRQQLPLFSCLATVAMLRLIPYLLLLLLALPGGTLAQTVPGCGSSAFIYRNGVPANSIDVMFRDSQTGESVGWGYIAMNLSALTLPEPIATDQTVPGTINIAVKLGAFVGSIQGSVQTESMFQSNYPGGGASCSGDSNSYISFPMDMPQNVVFASTMDYNGLLTGILTNPILGIPQCQPIVLYLLAKFTDKNNSSRSAYLATDWVSAGNASDPVASDVSLTPYRMTSPMGPFNVTATAATYCFRISASATVDSTSPCARMVINELQIVIDPSCVESFPNSFRVTTVNSVTVSPVYSYRTWREQTYGVMTITSLASTFPVTPAGGLYVCLAMSRNSRCGTPAGLCYGNSCAYSLLNADNSCCPASQVPY